MAEETGVEKMRTIFKLISQSKDRAINAKENLEIKIIDAKRFGYLKALADVQSLVADRGFLDSRDITLLNNILLELGHKV